MGYDIQADVTIDQLRLDREWVKQPKLFLHYSEALAKARTKMDRAKDNVDFVKADLDGIVRDDMNANGVKITEASVQSNISIHPDMQAALLSLADARDEVNMMQAAVSALEHKKYALQNLVSLHSQNYFSSLTVGEEDREAAQEIQHAPAKRAEQSMGARGVTPRRRA